MKKITNYLNQLITDRGKGKNSKIFVGLIFSVVMIIGLFVGVDIALYQTFAFTTLALFGISAVDNLSAPKIEVNKQETTTSNKTTTIDVADSIKNMRKKDNKLIEGKLVSGHW